MIRSPKQTLLIIVTLICSMSLTSCSRELYNLNHENEYSNTVVVPTPTSETGSETTQKTRITGTITNIPASFTNTSITIYYKNHNIETKETLALTSTQTFDHIIHAQEATQIAIEIKNNDTKETRYIGLPNINIAQHQENSLGTLAAQEPATITGSYIYQFTSSAIIKQAGYRISKNSNSANDYAFIFTSAKSTPTKQSGIISNQYTLSSIIPHPDSKPLTIRLIPVAYDTQNNQYTFEELTISQITQAGTTHTIATQTVSEL